MPEFVSHGEYAEPIETYWYRLRYRLSSWCLRGTIRSGTSYLVLLMVSFLVNLFLNMIVPNAILVFMGVSHSIIPGGYWFWIGMVGSILGTLPMFVTAILSTILFMECAGRSGCYE